MIAFDDAVVAANLPANQKHCVFYVDGKFANGTAVKKRCPGATYLGITVFGATAAKFPDAVFLDFEKGNTPSTVAGVVAWVEKQLALKVYRPGVYANEDSWKNQGLEAALAKYGTRIRRWMALWDNVATIPSGYDAKQYINDVAGADRNIALDTFFDIKAPKPTPAPKPKPTPAPTPTPVPPKPTPANNTGEVRFAGSLDLANNKWTIYRLISTGNREIGETYRATIEIDVGPDAPDILHIHRSG